MMRVVEPHQFSKLKKKKQKKRLPVFAAVPGVIVLTIVGYVLFAQERVHRPDELPQSQSQEEVDEAEEKVQDAKLQLRTFNDEQFKDLYTSFAYPNTHPLIDYPDITGNSIADERIRELAEERGYSLSAVPVANIVRIDEPYLTADDLLQQNAKIGWDNLSKSAADASVPLQITSAYRSIEFQRNLFLQLMRDDGITAPGVADGYSDVAIQSVMDRVAPPGFSRHHNGYTIDLACDGIGLYGFKNTSCYEWISKNNFEVAKKFGWVPSYPEEATQQGPNPEPWEFIWVGTINLYE